MQSVLLPSLRVRASGLRAWFRGLVTTGSRISETAKNIQPAGSVYVSTRPIRPARASGGAPWLPEGLWFKFKLGIRIPGSPYLPCLASNISRLREGSMGATIPAVLYLHPALKFWLLVQSFERVLHEAKE